MIGIRNVRSLSRDLVVGLGVLATSAALLSTPASGDDRVLWKHRLEGSSFGREAKVGPDGTIYTSDSNRLYAFSPTGELLWTLDGVGLGRPVSFMPDGTIITGGNLVAAVNPDGTLKWQFDNPTANVLAAGPNIGPDGNIYVAQEERIDPGALGVFSLDPDGNLRWSGGRLGQIEGPSFHNIVFDTDRFYVTVQRLRGGFPSLLAYDYDGELLWQAGEVHLAVGSEPMIHPNGEKIIIRPQMGMLSFDGDGSTNWESFHPGDGSLIVDFDIGADGTIYTADWLGADWWVLDENGNTQWFAPSAEAMIFSFALSPDEQQFITSGQNTFGVSQWIRGYDIASQGERFWEVQLLDEEGFIQIAGPMGSYSADGNVAYFATGFASDFGFGYIYAIDISPDFDSDGDGIPDIDDNCPHTANADQADADGDGIGDVCDPFFLPDDCVDAIEICPGVTVGNTIGATNDGLSTCSPNADRNKDVWYVYTPATDGTVTVDGCGSGFSFFLSAHSGCPGDVSNEVACDFDSCGGVWPTMTFDVVAGQSYYIRVTGFNDNEIEYQLTLAGPECGTTCPADLDGDGDADADDFFFFLDAFASGALGICDMDADGDCDADDFFSYLDLFAAGC